MDNGVTKREIKSGYGLDAQNELKMLEVICEVNREGEVDLIPTFWVPMFVQRVTNELLIWIIYLLK